jgi:transcriptional regulator with XRE-family HTH domain
MPAKQPSLHARQIELLANLGERLRLARLRRGLGVEITCRAAGISRMTLYRAERGSSAVALGTLVRILSVLALDADVELIARTDELGRMLQDEFLAPRRAKRGDDRRRR